MTIGQRLRSAREAKQMSIGDIARRTFIQPKFLQAIDEDNLALLPESHRRLFVREYAKVVGVDPNELLTMLPEYEAPPPTSASVEMAPRPQPRRSGDDEPPPPPVSTMPETDRKAYGEVMRRLSSGRGMKLSGGNMQNWLIGGALFLLLLIGVYYIFFSGNVEHPDAAGVDESDSAGSPTEIISRSEGDSAAPVQGAETPSDDSLTLEGRATGKVWFAIVMDGTKSETGTMDSGAVKTWRAAETFRLSLGNAGGLQLSLNEKSIGTLGPLKTSVRNQIIDVNGVRKTTPGRRSGAASNTGASSQRRTTQRRITQPRVITPTEMRTERPSQQR